MKRGEATRREPHDARTALIAMLKALDVSDAQRERLFADRGLYRLMLGFCMDVQCNMQWYRPRVQSLIRSQRWILALILIVSLGVVGVLLFVPPDSEAWVGVLIAGALVVLQVMVTTSDRKVQIGLFHKAHADLAEIQFTLEDTWCGRVMDGDQAATEWIEALRAGRAAARAIVRNEREAYFDAMTSPNDILQILIAGVDTVRGRRAERETAAQAKRERRIADLQQAGTLSGQVRDIENELDALQKELAAATEPEVQASLRTRIAEAEGRCRDARALYREVVAAQRS